MQIKKSGEKMNDNIEIERKYVIKMPDVQRLRAMAGYDSSQITQAYLACEDDGVTERVRMRKYPEQTLFYHTVKRRIDKTSCIEDEEQISAGEYSALLLRRDTSRAVIEKTRHSFPFGGFTVEIDEYVGWKNIAVMEIELPSREIEPPIPSFIEALFEASGKYELSNAGLSAHFPTEDEVLLRYL